MLPAKNFVKALLCAVLLFSAPFGVQAASKKDTAVDAGPVYVDFKNIVVPVIRKNGRTGLIAFSVMAEVKDENAKSTVTSHMPRLRDAFIRSLYGNLDNHQFTRQNGTLNIDQIRNRLMQTAELVLKGQDKPIKDILFQNISQQTY